MGCGFSRLGGNGLAFPAKIRPLVFLQDMKIHKSKRPLKNSYSTPSKKLLLLHAAEKDEDDNSFSSCKTPSKSDRKTDIEESSRGKGQNGHEDHIINEDFNAEIEDEFIDASNHEDDERMIGNNDGFIGSPSFRVYCNNNEKEEYFDAGNNQDTSEDSVSSADTPISPEVKSVVDEKKKAEKRGKSKTNSLKKVLPKVFSGKSRNRKSSEEGHQNPQ